jgi:hypothetical protein
MCIDDLRLTIGCRKVFFNRQSSIVNPEDDDGLSKFSRQGRDA